MSNFRKYSGLAVLFTLALYSSSSGAEGDCGVCDSDAGFCFSLTEHRFTGTAQTGYEGYHSNDECGTCGSAHVLYGYMYVASVKNALAGQGDLAQVIEKDPETILYNSATRRLTVLDCTRTKVLETVVLRTEQAHKLDLQLPAD